MMKRKAVIYTLLSCVGNRFGCVASTNLVDTTRRRHFGTRWKVEKKRKKKRLMKMENLHIAHNITICKHIGQQIDSTDINHYEYTGRTSQWILIEKQKRQSQPRFI